MYKGSINLLLSLYYHNHACAYLCISSELATRPEQDKPTPGCVPLVTTRLWNFLLTICSTSQFCGTSLDRSVMIHKLYMLFWNSFIPSNPLLWNPLKFIENLYFSNYVSWFDKKNIDVGNIRQINVLLMLWNRMQVLFSQLKLHNLGLTNQNPKQFSTNHFNISKKT